MPEKIVVEVLTPEVVEKLNKRIDDLQAEVDRLRSQHTAFHGTLYELIEVVGSLRRSLRSGY